MQNKLMAKPIDTGSELVGWLRLQMKQPRNKRLVKIYPCGPQDIMAKAVREKCAKKTILNVFLLISGTFNLTSTVLAILIFSLTGEIYSGLSFICDLCGNIFCHKNNVF